MNLIIYINETIKFNSTKLNDILKLIIKLMKIKNEILLNLNEQFSINEKNVSNKQF